MHKADIILLMDLLRSDVNDMPMIIEERLKSLDFKVRIDLHDNIIGYKGRIKNAPLLIAHTDTLSDERAVHPVPINGYIVSIVNGLQTILGADDRAGCAAILQLAPYIENLMVLFCANEEWGSIGAQSLDMQLIKQASIALELDRRTHHDKHDAVWCTNGVSIASKAFKEHSKLVLNQYNYHLSDGSFTDIGILKKRGLKCSAYNMSIGYLGEHSSSERLHIASYEDALNCTHDLIRSCEGLQFPHEPAPMVSMYLQDTSWLKDYPWKDEESRKSRKKRMKRIHKKIGALEKCEICTSYDVLQEVEGLRVCTDCARVYVRT